MSYQRFKAIVKSVCAKTGGGIKLRFRNEDGMFFAEYDDITVTANRLSTALTWNFGSGHGTRRAHTAMVKVGDLV